MRLTSDSNLPTRGRLMELTQFGNIFARSELNVFLAAESVTGAGRYFTAVKLCSGADF